MPLASRPVKRLRLRSVLNAPGLSSASGHAPDRRRHLRHHRHVRDLWTSSDVPGNGTWSGACGRTRVARRGSSWHPDRPTLPAQPRHPVRLAPHPTYFLRRRPYSSRRSSLEMGFRCMKLQKPPRVHSLGRTDTVTPWSVEAPTQPPQQVRPRLPHLILAAAGFPKVGHG